METKDKIRQRMNALNLKSVDLIRATGASKGTVSQWLSGAVRPGNKYINPLCKALDCTSVWLLNDGGLHSAKEESATYFAGVDTWDSSTELPPDEVELPFFTEVEAAAGGGNFHVQENHGPKLRFSKATLDRYNIQASNAACIKVKGNSMEPVLPDGSTIGVDTANKSIIDGKMFAVDHDGMLRVKMLYRMPGGGLRLRSYNLDEHPDEHYNSEDAKHIRVIGKVFWSSVLY